MRVSTEQLGAVKLVSSAHVPDDGKFYPDPQDSDMFLCGPETMRVLEAALKRGIPEEWCAENVQGGETAVTATFAEPTNAEIEIEEHRP